MKTKALTLRWAVLLFALSAILFLGACHKKTPPPPPPPPPAPAAPTATLTASPGTITSGQSSTLTWQTSDATDVSIDPIGAVQPNGTQSVSPAATTTYTLTAKGAGGTQTATAMVTVNMPAPPPPPPAAVAPTMTDEDMFAQNMKDIYFDYDKSDLRPSDQASAQADVAFLQAHPNINFTVEGHCDERGSTEYNLALGDNRASSVKNALVAGRISADRIKTVSLGKEKPFCTESNEACWQQNRRGHFVYAK
jgi:peptidoglycan-associated lipoprotein